MKLSRSIQVAAFAVALCCLPVLLALSSPPAAAQNPGAASRPQIDPTKVKVPVPRSVQAVQQLLGMGRPRLALVIGNTTVDRKTALPAAARDAQAVAAALRAGGFVVMVREELSAAEIRANLDEFRQRLEPESAALIYFTGLGAQVDGRNVVLGRNAQIPPGASPEQVTEAWKKAGVPLAELVNVLEGPPGSPRLLVVDASYQIDAIAKPPKPGLAEQQLPPGLMALSVAAPNATVDTGPTEALPIPAPTDPRRIAATLFGRELVRALTSPGISAPDAMRLTRRAVLDATSGKQAPWLAGDTDNSEDFADAKLLDVALPRSPQEAAQELAKQAAQETLQSRQRAQAGSDGPRARAPESAPQSGLPTEQAMSVAKAVAGTAVTGALAAKAAEAAGTAAAVTTAANAATSAGAAAADLASRARPMSAATPSSLPPVQPPAALAPAAPATPTLAPPAQVAAARPSAPTLPPLPPAPAPAPPQATRNPFGYAVGDTFTYRVVDGWKGQTSGTFAHIIEEVMPDGTLRGNNNYVHLDPQGRVITQITPRGRHEYQPVQELWWNNPKRGESRDVKFREFYERPDARGEIEWKGDLSVGRPRTIELPAGKFDVIPIHGDGWYTETNINGKGSGRWSRTVWYSPQLGHPVAIDIEETDWSGRLAKRERVELMHAQKASPQKGLMQKAN